MRFEIKSLLSIASFGALLLVAPPSHAAALSGASNLTSDALTSSLVQQVHAAPAGAKCIKWTRRWNTRHGFGHRRCVQWR
ncbi:hypothetical protein [Methylocystis parvus]|uniref:hypothetical protein n=1 Tax=Methylocystis parvus TaxID=134 RepID=UPI003C720C76